MAEKVGDVSDLLKGGWEMRKNRSGEDSNEIILGGVHTSISVRLMGRSHADEQALARIVLERMNKVGE